MKKLGKIIHRQSMELIVKFPAESGINQEFIGREVFSPEGMKLGKLQELFGPVRSPYGVVRLSRRIAPEIDQIYLR